METLIFLLLVIPIALVVLMIMLLGKISGLSREMEATRKQLAAFMHSAQTTRGPATSPPAAVPSSACPPPRVMVTPPPTATQPPPPPPPQPTPPNVPPAPPVRPPEISPEELREEEMRRRRLAAMLETEPIPTGHVAASRRPAAFAVDAPGATTTRPPLPPPPPPRPSFWDRNPDLEKFIGENLINKIGITVLVIGIGLFLNYAIDQGLISKTAQIMIGLAAGGMLVFFAHRLRNSFRAFSSVLVGGGIAVFYFSIATAFHKYEIIGQTAAFITMIAITGVAVLLTLAYDRKELAVISLLGGFATPFMVATGEGNFKVLFTYLLILNLGMLVLSNYKKWHIINVLSFALTLMIFGGWMFGPYDRMDSPPALAAFGYATAFFLVFFGMNLRYNLRHRQAFAELDHGLLLVNTAAYYGAGIFFLSDLTVRVNGLFTVLLGLFYLLFALYFHRREGIPASLKFMLIGLVLTFISLAAPVQLEGNHITLFWAAEAVLLLWFAQRTGLRLVERGALVVSGLMVVSLWMDMINIYGAGPETAVIPLFNKGWITGMVAALSLALTTWLLQRSDRMVEVLPGFQRSHWRLCAVVLGAGILFLVNYLEIREQLGRIYMAEVVNMALMCWALFFLLALDFFLRNKAGWRGVPAVLMSIAAVVYITAFYLSSRSAFHSLVSGEPVSGAYVFHYLGLGLMAITVWRLIQFGRERLDRGSDGWAVHLWAIAIFLVFFASQELDHIMVLANNSSEALNAARRIGYPILWGVGSFIFMWVGMRRRVRMLRVIALFLFGITLLKLFLFDLGSLSEGGRVGAFIFLGILLLVISFMYQKLKGLVMADGTEAPPIDDAEE